MDDETRMRLDTLEAQNAQLQLTLDTILERVSGLIAEATPMLEKLQNHPLAKMFGGK